MTLSYAHKGHMYNNIAYLFMVIVVGICFYLNYNHPIDVSEELQNWSYAHIILHSLPIFIYLKRYTSQTTNFPFIQTLSFFNIIHFGLPVFYIKTFDFQLGNLESQGLEIAFYAYLFFYIAYYFFMQVLKTKPLEFIPVGTPLSLLKSFSYLLLSIYSLRYVTDESSIFHIGNIGFYIYTGLSINFWRYKLLNFPEKAIFLSVLLYELIVRSLTGLIAGAALMIFFISLCVIMTKSSKIIIVAGMIVFIWFYSIFSVIKTEFRSKVWFGGKEYSISDRIELIQNLYDQKKLQNSINYVDNYKGKEQFLWRFSYQLSALSMVIIKTPKQVPFWEGESYIPLITKFIPRILWENKPSENMGQIFGRRYLILSYYDKRTSMNTPIIPEFYFNFGFLGMYVCCVFLGLLFAFLTRLFNSNTVSYASKIIGMAIIFPLVIWESNFSLTFGNLILVSFFLILFFKFVDIFFKK